MAVKSGIRPITVTLLSFSTQDFAKLPLDEQILFVRVAHAYNDLRYIQQLVVRAIGASKKYQGNRARNRIASDALWLAPIFMTEISFKIIIRLLSFGELPGKFLTYAGSPTRMDDLPCLVEGGVPLAQAIKHLMRCDFLLDTLIFFRGAYRSDD